MEQREVAVVTGTRAEYGLLQSPMEHITEHGDLRLRTVVTGMHLSPQHGNTYREIEDDGFTVDRKVDMLLSGDTGASMASSLGVGIQGMAQIFRDLDPDVVLVLGDRDEPLGAAAAAAHMTIPVAHIHGGDVAVGSCIDDSIRHSLTKFSHLHFPATEESARRVSQLGEEEWRITVIGAPGLDKILESEYATSEEIYERYDLKPSEPLILAIQHPLTTQPDRAADQLAETMDALATLEGETVLVYPNADAGGKDMIQVIDSHPASNSFVVRKNIPRYWYLGVMNLADVMVGNSSGGLIETPSFDLPVVDVGPRQTGRQRASNTVQVPHDAEEIRAAAERCLSDEEIRREARNCENPYNHGGAGERIAERLATVSIDEKLLQKKLAF